MDCSPSSTSYKGHLIIKIVSSLPIKTPKHLLHQPIPIPQPHNYLNKIYSLYSVCGPLQFYSAYLSHQLWFAYALKSQTKRTKWNQECSNCNFSLHSQEMWTCSKCKPTPISQKPFKYDLHKTILICYFNKLNQILDISICLIFSN